jgi:AraC-like DNA-binding protein
MTRFIRSASLTNFQEVARSVGLDPERMLRESGLPPGCLQEPDLMIPLESVRQILEAAAERSGVEGFGLLMAEARKLSSLGPLGMLLREQPTLRQAVEALARYARVFNEALFLTLEESGDVFVVREEVIFGDEGSVRQSTELAIGVAFQALRSFLGPGWTPLRICFAHDAPADLSVHRRLFGRNVEFGHDFNGIVCARRDLLAANPHADPAMARYAQQLLDAAQPAVQPTLAAEVRQLVLMQLSSGRCKVDRAAQLLGIDRRTLHRRLASEGQSFSEIVDAVRRELAARYTASSTRSMAEVSSLLGFSAPSGFSRWYRQQFGASPSGRRTRRPPFGR